jgi:hypothetical protein
MVYMFREIEMKRETHNREKQRERQIPTGGKET